MTVSTAMRLCPRGVFVPPDWDFFRSVSSEVFSVIRRYSPVVETVSLDEGYVDYTGCSSLFGHVLDAGRTIRREVSRRTGLDLSLGIASNKLVSHVASRQAKRASMIDVYPGRERYFLSPVAIERFPLAGGQRLSMLRELGISVVGDVQRIGEELLSFCFGPWGRRLYRGAMGEDQAGVRRDAGRGAEFAATELLQPDMIDRHVLGSFLSTLCERLGRELRRERSLARALSLEVRYADGISVRGTERLPAAASDGSALSGTAAVVFDRLFARRVRVRRLTLSAGPVEPEPLQIDLFPGPAAKAACKAQKVQDALDRLRASMPAGVAPVYGRELPAAAR
jgi:DNA polymerase-4